MTAFLLPPSRRAPNAQRPCGRGASRSPPGLGGLRLRRSCQQSHPAQESVTNALRT
jgi:hypothetical protein